MRLTIGFCLVVGASAIGGAHAEPTDPSPRVYAVHIVQDPGQSRTGYGIYLGKGLVINAANVVNSNEPG